MSRTAPAHVRALRSRLQTPSGAAAASETCAAGTTPSAVGITFYGCEPAEAVLIHEMAPLHGVVPTITATALSQTTLQLAEGNHCISVGHKSQIPHALLRELGRVGVRYISTRSAGSNHIDVGAAEVLGIAVGNVSYSPASVADYTLMLILMAVRNTKTTLTCSQAHDYRLSDTRGRELRDMAVGVVGTGRIGTAVLERLRGFGCRVFLFDCRPDLSAEYVSLDVLLRESDVVTLHTPLTPLTHHLLDRQRIGRMKPGSFLVNTGRGALVETKALVDALESGRLGGAALDVLEGEEGVFYADHRRDPAVHPLLSRLQQMQNVVITPHTAYYTDHALRDTIDGTLANCVRFLEGDCRG